MNASPVDYIADSTRLLADVRDLLDLLDPVPADLAGRAKFSISARAMDAEVAQLLSADLVALRGATAQQTGRLFTSAGGLSVQVDLSGDMGGHVRIDGWVSATPAEILAYAADDPMSVAARPPLARSTTDEFGRFLLTVSGTPVVLLVRSPTGGAGAVLTPPLEL